MKFIFYLIILFFIMTESTIAQNAKNIMLEVSQAENKIMSSFYKGKLSTSRYYIQNGKIILQENPRVKIFQSAIKYYSKVNNNGKRDSKSVSILVSPISEKGIANLTYSYKEDDKDDDQWIFFSALGKVKRLISHMEDNDVPNISSLFGSEFNIEDLENISIHNFTYRIIKSEKFQGQHCWVIEKIPLPKQLKKSNYSKTIVWVDKKKKIFLKENHFNRQGKPFKQLTYTNWIQKNGIWQNRITMVRNIIEYRLSILEILENVENISIDDKYLTQRILTDQVFQNQMLTLLRSNINQ